ncbi:MAG: hypothetical protein HUJ58_02290 [Erysipelotrichaceae bacterium]|nr:hypothetical protein [Erysipelotrichaceae bacterium]
MRKLYDGQIVDYNDGHTEFVREFDHEVENSGAIVYNYESNTYQWIREFEQIGFKNDLLPYYFKVNASKLPKGIDILMKYEFNPDEETDEEILGYWEEAKEEEYPYFDYDDEGEIYEKSYYTITAQPSKHTIWILDDGALEYLIGNDPILLLPVIKNMSIVRELIQNHTVNPWYEQE